MLGFCFIHQYHKGEEEHVWNLYFKISHQAIMVLSELS